MIANVLAFLAVATSVALGQQCGLQGLFTGARLNVVCNQPVPIISNGAYGATSFGPGAFTPDTRVVGFISSAPTVTGCTAGGLNRISANQVNSQSGVASFPVFATGSLSGNTLSGNSLLGNNLSGNSLVGNTLSANSLLSSQSLSAVPSFQDATSNTFGTSQLLSAQNNAFGSNYLLASPVNTFGNNQVLSSQALSPIATGTVERTACGF